MVNQGWARLAQLMLRKGPWGERRLISKRWIRRMTTPGEVNNAYGYLTWLNRGRTGSGPRAASASARTKPRVQRCAERRSAKCDSLTSNEAVSHPAKRAASAERDEAFGSTHATLYGPLWGRPSKQRSWNCTAIP